MPDDTLIMQTRFIAGQALREYIRPVLSVCHSALFTSNIFRPSSTGTSSQYMKPADREAKIVAMSTRMKKHRGVRDKFLLFRQEVCILFLILQPIK